MPHTDKQEKAPIKRFCISTEDCTWQELFDNPEKWHDLPLEPAEDAQPTFILNRSDEPNELKKQINESPRYYVDFDKKIAYKIDECSFTSEATPEGATVTIEGKNIWDEITSTEK